MADKVTFRGATISYYDGRKSEGGSFIRLHMTSEYTTPVADAMGWEDPGNSVDSAKLEGELVGTRFTMTPADKKLKDMAIALDINFVGDFQMVRVKVKDEIFKRELRFVMRSPSAEAAGLIDNYIRKCGDSEAALVVSYTVQQELDIKPETGASTGADSADDVGCVSCVNDIAFVDDKKKKHVNGVKCSRKITQIALVEPESTPSVQRHGPTRFTRARGI